MGDTKRSRKRNGQAKNSKRMRQEQEVDRKAEELTSLIFGNGGGDTDININTADQIEDIFEKRATPTSLLSKSATDELVGEDASSDDDDNEAKDTSSIDRTAAWEDTDSATIHITEGSQDRLKKLRDTRQDTNWHQSELEQRLRQRYQKTAVRTSRTNWAAVDTNTKKENEDDRDISMVESEAGPLFAKSRGRIPANIIDTVRLKDVNEQDPCGAVLRCVSFHQKSDPNEPLLLTAGLDKTVRYVREEVTIVVASASTLSLISPNVSADSFKLAKKKAKRSMAFTVS